jgi:hypothetical protein
LLEDNRTMPYKSDKRLYLNADRSKVVDEESADAAYLLVNAGGELTDAQAKQYGLSTKAKAAADDAAEPETKQISAAPENKAQTMEKSKDK